MSLAKVRVERLEERLDVSLEAGEAGDLEEWLDFMPSRVGRWQWWCSLHRQRSGAKDNRPTSQM